ncbi:hypothetical protein AALP_AA1G115500 [Arabis alpina]|uniref:Uncharacterized protein n=1 Tax=Arabis alpina TaxID=50452 RepID=A0A087HMK5_ARAAL|nr:hypothetical protein AALP_AA1G115500 [Arabis alpina]
MFCWTAYIKGVITDLRTSVALEWTYLFSGRCFAVLFSSRLFSRYLTPLVLALLVVYRDDFVSFSFDTNLVVVCVLASLVCSVLVWNFRLDRDASQVFWSVLVQLFWSLFFVFVLVVALTEDG